MTSRFGNRTEIKNMSSFRFIMEALEYETKRQAALLESGREVEQETRLFDESKKITLPMRSKEDAPDYRYFPDPDLVDVEIDTEFLRRIEEAMPELPDQKIRRMMEQHGIPEKDVLVLTRERAVSEFFETCIPLCDDKRRLSSWITKDLFKLLNETATPIEDCPVSAEGFSRLVNLITRGDITERIARTVLEAMFKTGDTPEVIIERNGLKPIQDEDLLEAILDQVLAENPQLVEQIQGGVRKPVDYLVGQVMKRTKGKADAKRVKELLARRLGSP
jgi:aspartyl-tRNA(Asn)/glutamyl-tRNA(Gln) amidotransferase subunit B